ncbi:MAG TPA: thrombospondin type 3 repeat-containing protein [Kiritimatiellia bacterium]|nr:thrombospondin type 3 repeat-containing protein [Kiritimatiellia bacterium]HRZ11393.1 thrombospondin type 3 repeat-containing protein [Kiritimatiellia bacterium]HSA17056.1 thrombospondin type 3 repeat-containing protein [Kiritimatiellia bacterium]
MNVPFMPTAGRTAFGLLFALCLHARAEGPAWWTTRGVLDTNAPAGDYAPVNQGQLKHIAVQACSELDDSIAQFGGAGTAISNLVAGFSNTTNYAPVNIGQLKNTALPFCERLMAIGYTNDYPWAGASATNDYAAANIGQMKYLFSFDLVLDTDEDGMPDWWELANGFDPEGPSDAEEDPDADGYSNQEEYQAGTDPAGFNPSPVVAITYPRDGEVLP